MKEEIERRLSKLLRELSEIESSNFGAQDVARIKIQIETLESLLAFQNKKQDQSDKGYREG